MYRYLVHVNTDVCTQNPSNWIYRSHLYHLNATITLPYIYHAQRALARENAEIQNNRNYNYARNRMLEYFQAHYYVEFMWFAFTSVYIVCTMHKMLWCWCCGRTTPMTIAWMEAMEKENRDLLILCLVCREVSLSRQTHDWLSRGYFFWEAPIGANDSCCFPLKTFITIIAVCALKATA